MTDITTPENGKVALDFFKHVEYYYYEGTWRTIQDLLDGHKRCLVDHKYLWFHPSEQASRACDDNDRDWAQQDRRLRETRTQYVNYMKMVQQRFVTLIMKGGLNLSEVQDVFGDYADNIDGNDKNVTEFALNVAEDVISYGVGYIFTDTQTIEARSVKEARELNSRPYWIKIHPIDLKDWQIGTDGRYSAFRYEYDLTVQRERLSDEPKLYKYNTVCAMQEGSYTITTYVASKRTTHFNQQGVSSANTGGDYTPINYHPECSDKYDGELAWVEVESTLVDNIDEVPLATNRIQESFLKDVIPLALKIYNKQSDLDNILYNQGYDKLFVIGDLSSITPVEGSETDTTSQQIKLSTSNMLNLPEGSVVEKIDPTNPEALFKSIELDIVEMMKIAFNISRMIKADSGVAEGKDAKREAKEDLLTRIESKRTEVISILNTGTKHFARHQGKNTDGKISFNEAVTEQDLDELINFIRSTTDIINLYPKWRKAAHSKLAIKGNYPDEEEVLEEIQSLDPEARELERQEKFANQLESVANIKQPKKPKANEKSRANTGSKQAK